MKKAVFVLLVLACFSIASGSSVAKAASLEVEGFKVLSAQRAYIEALFPQEASVFLGKDNEGILYLYVSGGKCTPLIYSQPIDTDTAGIFPTVESLLSKEAKRDCRATAPAVGSSSSLEPDDDDTSRAIEAVVQWGLLESPYAPIAPEIPAAKTPTVPWDIFLDISLCAQGVDPRTTGGKRACPPASKK